MLIRDFCTIVLLLSSGRRLKAPTFGKNVLNRSFILYKLPHSVHFRLARKQNYGSCKGLNLKISMNNMKLYIKNETQY